jgi:hydroxymethylbilane synthase
MEVKTLIIGSRGSQLALWQTNYIKSTLESLHPALSIRVEIIKTLGDKILDSPLSKIGDKGLFTKEIEHALLEKKIDLAVHSLKDIPTKLPDGLTIGAITKREDVRDVFIANKRTAIPFAELPKGAAIATGSLRRKSQLLRHRPDFIIMDIRGNLNTRMQKLDESEWGGMILAKAGVMRLGWDGRITDVLPFDIMLPAVGQGALAVEIRSHDTAIKELIQPLHHEPTARAVYAERALLRRLEGGCQVPIGAIGVAENSQLTLQAMIGSLDGKRVVRGFIKGLPGHAEQLGTSLAEQLLARGGKEILDEIILLSRTTEAPEA